MIEKKAVKGRLSGRFRAGLRCKTALILAATIIAAALAVALASRYFFEGSIDRIESREASDALRRAWAIVRDDMEQLDVIVYDWATWDDTWAFMNTRDAKYVESNLAFENLLSGLKISALLILDSEGGVAFGAAEDELWLGELVESYRAAKPTSDSDWSRVIDAAGSLHLSAARPITRSDGSGERRGTFVMSKIIDSALLGRYSRLSGLEVDIRKETEPSSPGPRSEAPRQSLTAEPAAEGLAGPISISLERGVIEARAGIPLPGTSDRAEIAVSMRRDLDRYGGTPLILFICGVFLAIVLVGMTAILLFEAAVLGRMRSMGSELALIADKGESGLRLTESGNDELTALVRIVNSTLDRFYALIADRDAAIREIHHRVKNNLQVISSLVSLQAGKASGCDGEALFDIRRRVLAIAFVHEELYLDREIERVEAERLISRLASMVADGFDAGPRIRVDIDCGRFSLKLESAVPVGLVICEIIANSFAHAFSGGAGGTIRVCARAEADGSLRLSIDDDGIGIAGGAGRGLGLNLVETLSRQAQAVYELKPREGGGTSFLIVVPGAVSA